jgi:4-hydroxybenzoate polyprenyltransferase
MNLTKELFEFLRIKLCIFAPFGAMIGYLLFSQLSFSIIHVILGAFFACVAVYSYNEITDRKEDEVNRGKVNYFAKNISGSFISTGSALLGVFFSYLVSYIAFVVCILFTISVAAYSTFRAKKYFLVKNLYTSFGVSLLFLMGVSNVEQIGTALLYYLFISMFILVGSLISDLRDAEGDKKVGLRTLPIVIGAAKTKHLIYGLCAAFLLSVTSLNLYPLQIAALFLIAVAFLVPLDKYKAAHSMSRIALLFVWMALMFTQFYL